MKENLPKTIAICVVWIVTGVVAIWMKDVTALAYALGGTFLVFMVL